MTRGPDSLSRSGGISLILSGVLFLLGYLLVLAPGLPPAEGADILAWMASGKLPFSLAAEALFFAAVLLVPGLIALYPALAGTDRMKAAVGCGLFAITIPVILVLDVILGRFVFPVYGLAIDTPAIAELAVALYTGGVHMVALLFGIASIVAGLAMRRGVFGRNIASLCIAAGISDILGANPWVTGPVPALVAWVLTAAWFTLAGMRLCRGLP